MKKTRNEQRERIGESGVINLSSIFQSIGFQPHVFDQAIKFPTIVEENLQNFTNEKIRDLLGKPIFYNFIHWSAQRCRVSCNSFANISLSQEVKSCIFYLADTPNIHTIQPYVPFLTLALQACLEHDLKNTLRFFNLPPPVPKSARK